MSIQKKSLIGNMTAAKKAIIVTNPVTTANVARTAITAKTTKVSKAWTAKAVKSTGTPKAFKSRVAKTVAAKPGMITLKVTKTVTGKVTKAAPLVKR